MSTTSSSPVQCPTCWSPVSEDRNDAFDGQRAGYFAHSTDDPPIPTVDDLSAWDDEQETVIDWTRAVFHAIFCVWHYEKDADGGMQHKSVDALTALGQALCDEIDRRGHRLYKAGKKWQERAEALSAGQPPAEASAELRVNHETPKRNRATSPSTGSPLSNGNHTVI